MKKKLIQIHEVEPEEFKNEILAGVEQLFKEFSKNFEPKAAVWLSRKDVTELLGISLVTIHNWGKNGILKPYKIGNMVRFRLSDIEKVLLQSNQRASQ